MKWRARMLLSLVIHRWAQRFRRNPMTVKIYLAGPDVFLLDALEVGERKKSMCREFGFEGEFPFDTGEVAHRDPGLIYRRNRDRMDMLKAGVFNLTPFRGPSADPGTVFELGYMIAAGKRVFGYSSAAEIYQDRVARTFGPLRAERGRSLDRNDLAVEDFHLDDNLMIAEAIRQSGGFIEVVAENADTPAAALPAFQAFRACLARLRGLRDELS